MFYTLASKLLIKGPPKNRDFLYVFLAGSVMYVALHWYLNLDEKTGIVEQVRKYLYYTMAVDLGVAYVMTTYFAPAAKEGDEDKDDTKSQREYTDEEKKIIRTKMHEARRQQMQRQQLAIANQQQMEQRQLEGGGGAGGTGHAAEDDAESENDRQAKGDCHKRVKSEKIATPNVHKKVHKKVHKRERVSEHNESSTRDKPSIFSKSTASDTSTESAKSVSVDRRRKNAKTKENIENLDTNDTNDTNGANGANDPDEMIKISTKRSDDSKKYRVKKKGSIHESERNESVLDDTEIPMFAN